MSPPLTPGALDAIIGDMAGRAIVVIGDPVLDTYIYGTTVRISREAPVPIVRADSTEHRLGGAANAAANLAALGARTTLVGLVGDDEGAEHLARLCRAVGIDASPMHRTSRRRTITKTRVLAGGLHTTKQQMLRIDREDDGAPHPDDAQALLDRAAAAIVGADAVIISDYGNLTDLYAAVAAAAPSAKIIVDSRYALMRFAGVTAVTPNEPEAEAALGVTLDSELDAVAAAERIQTSLDLDATLLTRGREGMAIARRGEAPLVLEPHGLGEAVDVTGAGDTVTATFALAMATGAGVLEAAVLANCAASTVVQQIGAATCGTGELRRIVARWNPGALRSPR